MAEFYKVLTGVGDGGHTRVRDHGAVFARKNARDYVAALFESVVLVVAYERLFYIEMIEEFEKCLMTDISRNQYLDIINDVAEVKYTKNDYYTPEGTQSAEGRYDEFYVDEDALLKMVVDLFYIKQR